MAALFPESPFIPASTLDTAPVCEWIAPAVPTQRGIYFSACKVLPPGIPDCLQLEIGHSEEGAERCTAAIYGERAYVIHFEFKPRRSV